MWTRIVTLACSLALMATAASQAVAAGSGPGGESGRCDPGPGGRALVEIRGEGGRFLGCTHGPDPAPPGIDLTAPVAVRELRARDVPREEWGTCPPDGTSGFRVQALYAYPADRATRYPQIQPLVQAWANANVDEVIQASAAETGGTRRVRFVTDASCQVVVDEVRLSGAGDDSFAQTVSELRALGYDRPDRKYLVWMDAPPPAPYCGIAQMYPDDRYVADNYNNGHAAVPGMVARIDPPCWGIETFPVEAHELMHTLGAVQPSSPHATAGGHCWDEYDLMCHDDDGDGPMTVAVMCSEARSDRRFDCGHDDYFHTDPPAGSYLDTHWNAAASRFLDDLGPAPPVDPACQETGGSVRLTPSRRVVPKGTKVTLRLRAAPCPIPVSRALLRTGRRVVVHSVEDARAAFRVRLPRTTHFRASIYDHAGTLLAQSERITVRVR